MSLTAEQQAEMAERHRAVSRGRLCEWCALLAELDRLQATVTRLEAELAEEKQLRQDRYDCDTARLLELTAVARRGELPWVGVRAKRYHRLRAHKGEDGGVSDDLRAEAGREFYTAIVIAAGRYGATHHQVADEVLGQLAASPAFLAWALVQACEPRYTPGTKELRYAAKPGVAALLERTGGET